VNQSDLAGNSYGWLEAQKQQSTMYMFTLQAKEKGKLKSLKSAEISIRTDIFQGTSHSSSTGEVFDTFGIN